MSAEYLRSLTKATVILVPPQDPEKLAGAMETMLQTYQNYDATALREGVIKKFSNETVGKLLNSIYKSL